MGNKKNKEEMKKLDLEYVKLFLSQLKRKNEMHREAMRIEKYCKVQYTYVCIASEKHLNASNISCIRLKEFEEGKRK